MIKSVFESKMRALHQQVHWSVSVWLSRQLERYVTEGLFLNQSALNPKPAIEGKFF
jgi:hypothetical protein